MAGRGAGFGRGRGRGGGNFGAPVERKNIADPYLYKPRDVEYVRHSDQNQFESAIIAEMNILFPIEGISMHKTSSIWYTAPAAAESNTIDAKIFKLLDPKKSTASADSVKKSKGLSVTKIMETVQDILPSELAIRKRKSRASLLSSAQKRQSLANDFEDEDEAGNVVADLPEADDDEAPVEVPKADSDDEEKRSNVDSEMASDEDEDLELDDYDAGGEFDDDDDGREEEDNSEDDINF